MKKVLLTLLFAAIASIGMGQTLTVNYGNEWKKNNVSEINDLDIVGVHNGLTIATTHRYGTFFNAYKKKECMVVALDKGMNITRSLAIEGSDDDEVMASSISNGKLYILTYHKERGKEAFNRWVVNLESMTAEGAPQEVYSQSRERKDKTYQWVAQTEDRSVTGLVFITTNRKSDKFEANQFLLDEEMKIEWQREYPLHSMSQMLVTEDGEIITLGRSAERENTPSKIYATIINEDNTQDVDVTANLVVTDLRLISYSKGKMLIMGLGLNVSNKKEVRYFGATLDFATGKMNASYQSLTQLDLNVFNGDNQGRNSDPIGYDAFVMRHWKSTQFGAVGTLQVRWAVETCNTQGACNIKYYQQGVLIFAINDNGEILWHFPIRSDYAENGLSLLMANSLLVDGDDVYFVQTEHAKWPESYDLTKSMKTLKLHKGSKMIGVYHVSADGKMSKTKQQLEKKAVLAGTAKRFHNNYIGFLTLGKGVTPVELKIGR